MRIEKSRRFSSLSQQWRLSMRSSVATSAVRALTIAAALGTFVFSIPSAFAAPKKVWTVDEILAARKDPSIKAKPRYCQGGAFKPCVCPR
jgi:hypothetical protein